MQTVGWRGMPLNQQANNYTLQLSDRGKLIYQNAASSITYTVPASVFSAGDVVTAFNSGNPLTIAAGSGLSLYWANGTESNIGNRTLTGFGVATIVFLSSTQAIITGSGLS